MDSSVLTGNNLDMEGISDAVGILNDSLASEIMEDEEGMYTTTCDEATSKPLTEPPMGDDADDSIGKDWEEPPQTAASNKRKQQVNTSRPGGSNSKQRAPKKTKIEEFAGLVASEEQTCQGEIDLAKSKVVASAQVQVEMQKAKVESKKAKVKLERMKLASLAMKKDYKMEKLKLKHAREMAKINRTSTTASTATATHMMSSASYAGPSQPTDLMNTGSTFYSFTDLLESSQTEDAYFGMTDNTELPRLADSVGLGNN